jgi:hypothetical protein
MADGVEMLARLLAHCDTGAPMPTEARRALALAIRRTAATGDTLDSCLGISAAGRRSLQRRIARCRRDEAIVLAVGVVAIDEGLSDWQRCQRLAPLLAAFTNGRDWKETRYQPGPPDSWPAWKRLAWIAAATDEPIPTSARQLFEIVKRARGYSPHDAGVRLLASSL